MSPKTNLVTSLHLLTPNYLDRIYSLYLWMDIIIIIIMKIIKTVNLDKK